MFNVEVVCGIDRDFQEIEGLKVYTRDDELPKVDAVIITVAGKSDDIENFLNNSLFIYVYYEDLFDLR